MLDWYHLLLISLGYIYNEESTFYFILFLQVGYEYLFENNVSLKKTLHTIRKPSHLGKMTLVLINDSCHKDSLV